MIDKIQDIYFAIKDKLEEIWWFIQDNVKLTLGIIGVMGFIGLVILMLNIDNQNQLGAAGVLEENSVEQLAFLESNSLELKEVFSELQVMNSSGDNYPILEVSLYLKQPFMESSEIETYLDTYVELLKLKYNDSEENTKIKAINISIFDRQIVFERNLEPNGNYMYMLSPENVVASEETDDPYETANQGMTELAWNQTIESKGEPDYSKYASSFSYMELIENAAVEPLSDEEFEWYLKFEQYVTLGGGVDGGAQLYLQWDLGANLSDNSFIAVIDSFDMFIARLDAVEAKKEFYMEDPDALRRQLVITNPQFLLFADHDELIEEPFEARARLIEIDPDLYTSTVEDWIEEQAGNYDDSDDPASLDNPENKTNTQLIEDGELETQEEAILEQSSDSEPTETESTEESVTEDTETVESAE